MIRSYNRTLTMILFLVACVLIGATVQSEIVDDPSLCGRKKCKVAASRKFKYEEGISYWYRYTVDVNANLGSEHSSSSARNESRLRIDADLLVQFSNPCEGSIKFSNASISHDPHKYNPEFPDRAGAEFKMNLERFALTFAYDDGRIDELCPDKRDPVWALNLKRGVLSMLQNNMHRFDVDRRVDELDVNGICETNYRLYEARRTSLVVKKTKNLINCSHGSKYLSIVQSNAYKSPRSRSHPSRHPLLDSRSECELIIDHNIYEKIVCKDVHRLQPLSSGKTGARTESIAILQLIRESKDKFSEEYEWRDREEDEEEGLEKNGRFARVRRTSLLYDYAKTIRTVHGELRTSRDLLKTMCRLGANADELQQSFSETFTAFVHSARLLDYPSLSQLFARANSICKSGKRYIVQALPYLGSNAAVSVMKDLIIKKYIDQTTSNSWITAFALIPRPNQDTIRALSPLLQFNSQIAEAQFILSYSATIHAFCSTQETRCSNVDQVTQFLSYLEEKIQKGCSPRTHSLSTIKDTMEALKAIGNMGLETESIVKLLKECTDDVGGFLPMEIRVASIDAHRRMPSCERTRDDFFLHYYRNFTVDTEIRIASYLQVMRCPDYNVVKTIKHTLKMEEMNQVGSFVWSHLTNLYNSASPTRIEVQSLLTDRDLDEKFNSDRRKFSRNYDGSFFSEEYNFGANYQGNLIFSPKSYIPRTVTVNLTFDLFGESVNALEMTTRLEGLEYYAEHFFGPDGPYNSDKVSGMVKSFLRNFREAPERQDYWQGVKRLPNVIDNNFDNPRITLGYKIFGNDLKYTTLNGDREIRQALAHLNPWEKLKEIISNKEIRYENAWMFLDSTYVVPMTSGLPIRLDFAGSAACNFKMSGLHDTKRISKGEFQFVSNIAPSVSVDVIGSMSVDAFYKTAGIKLRSNVYSSGAVQINLDVKGMRSIRLSLGLPNNRMEVFSIGTDILLTKGNGAELEEKPIGVLIAGRNINSEERSKKQLAIVPGTVLSNTSCSWTALDRLIGLKLCVDYQLSNVTKNSNAPYFVLTGPTLFKISLIKADSTAKNYLLEYKWDKSEKGDLFRVAFDTPGSQVNRELSATVSFEAKTHNVTVLLRSAGNCIVATGTYKSTENETFIDIGFDINGTKHLDASLGYTTNKFQYGYTFSPQMHLIVNNERITALSGTIRNAWKNNVSQCDIDLSFRTKKVWSKLVGYIVRRNASLAGVFQLDYQLSKMPKKESVQLEVSLANRSTKTLTQKSADLRLRSTAYPQLNTVITAWYQQALGHLELHAEVNSSPHLMDDRHKLTIQLIVSYSKAYFQKQDTKANALIAITKPSQNLDIKLGINHDAMGPQSRTRLRIGYAPGKEISLAVTLIMPRGLMFAMESHANLTIPNFNSMLVGLRITERSKKTYDLDFSGTWFSGHNVTARGTYSDRSVATTVSHNLKLILKSSSFSTDILLNCKLYRNYSDVELNFYLEQLDRDKYAFILYHTVKSPTDFLTYIEGRYKHNVYSVMTNVDAKREIRVEVHLDKWRDVHLTLTGINEEEKKSFGAELKWDANRDPALKLSLFLSLDRVTEAANSDKKNVTGMITFTYPGRSITGTCHLAARGQYNRMMNVVIVWNPEDAIRLFVATGYDVTALTKIVRLDSRLLTPFDNWKRTAFNVAYRQQENGIKMSSSVYWKDSQHVIAELDGSTEDREKVKEWRANCGLTSTVHSISWTTVNITHKIVDSQIADTRLLVKYNPDKVIDAWSIWYLDKGSADYAFNITGNLHLEAPVASYRKSDLRCQLQVLPDWKFLGAANFDLDKRTYTGKLMGDLRRFKESMIEFNVTTPLEKFSFVRGRFGLSERNRHAVAQVVTPTGPIGFEALCQFYGLNYDFNVKLLLATPLEILQKSLLVAKLNNREADFRVAYNNRVAGFQGVWHYRNITDFHYTYLLFTPVRGFEEIGIVKKLIVSYTEDEKLDVDLEFTVKLSDTKVGVKGRAGPTPPPVHIPIKGPLLATNDSKAGEEDYSEGEMPIDEQQEESSLHWRGEVEIYPLIFEPVLGEVNVDNAGPTYKVFASFQLFQQTILLNDMFYIEDLFNIRNELVLTTPYKFANEIVCLNAFVVDMERSSYAMQFGVNVRRNVTWIETGLDVNYIYSEIETDDSRIHSLRLKVKTPLQFLQFLNSNITLAVDVNFCKAEVHIGAPSCTIELLGSLETEEAMIDSIVTARVDTPMFKLPQSTLVAKQGFAEKEKYVEISVDIGEPVSKSLSLQSDWYVAEDRAKLSVAFSTWIESLKSVNVDVFYSNTIRTNDTANLTVRANYLIDQQYKLLANYSGGKVNTQLYTPFFNDPRFQFDGNLTKLNSSLYNLNGQLLDHASKQVRKVFAAIVTRNDSLHAVEMTMQPMQSAASKNDLLFTLNRERYGFKLVLVSENLNGTLDATFVNSVNWNTRVRAEILAQSGVKKQLSLTTFMNVQVNGNSTLYVSAETPLEDIRNLSISGSMLVSNTSGDIRTNNRINGDTHYATVQWKLIYMADMFGRILLGYQGENLATKDIDTGIFFKNPARAFRNVDAGFHVDVDREKWKLATNATVGFRNHENIDGVFSVRLPPPNNDDHQFLIRYHANGGVKDLSYVIGYNAVRARTNYASDGSLRVDTRDIDGHLRASWGLLSVQSVNNLFNLAFDKKKMQLKYSLYTPKFQQQDTLALLFNYDATADGNVRGINADVYYPASTQVGSANISYESLVNVNGTINAVLPVANVSQLACHFIVLTTLQQNKRYVNVSWPKNTALLNSEYRYRSEKLDSDLEGVIHAEVPLSTRHVADLTYGYKKRPQLTTGYSELTYNAQKVLRGQYNSKSESRAGFEKDRIEITIENAYKPMGIVYVNQYEYSGGNEGTNYPTVELKQVNLYQLNNRTAFNVVAESKILTTHTGQDIQLKAIHSNRTVQLRTDYQVLPGEFDQNTCLSLAKDAWLCCRVNILNKTTEQVDNQFLVLSLSYPRRNFTLDGSYWISSEEFRSEVKLDWDRETERPRTVGALFNWQNVSSADAIARQRATFALRHPSFPKQVFLKGELLRRDARDLLNVALTADYSTDPSKLFLLSALVRDQSNPPLSRTYVYEVTGTHPSTKFDLDVRGFLRKHANQLFETVNNGSYKRSFLVGEYGQLNTRLDLTRKEILFHREYNQAIKHLYVRYYPSERRHVLNGSIANTPTLNATGAFLFDLDEKLTRLMLNYTPDAVHSLRMFGNIPDARNAVFDIWRTYEQDFSISDVSFYLKLNHSRLVTSTLRWRPSLRNDIVDGIKNALLSTYEGINNDADYWKQYVKSETVSTISDIWDNAHEDLQQFLDDWNNLKELETDLNELKLYLNSSYNANDFYIKDIVALAVQVIDELSLRSHIQSLPNILNEIWEIMGESGDAIRSSLLWLIETAKNAINKLSEILTAVIRGDSISQVANIIERLIEKYDKFVKGLHVSFIKYIEYLWTETSLSISQQWNQFLLMVEPLFIRFIHYLETVVWKASKEVVDFLYDRKNDLIASPYFDRFTNFTQDIDKFYRDIKANDIVTNIQKYSGLVVEFLKERYFIFVPFGKELKDVIDEIVGELKELQRLPSIRYALEKMDQLYDRAYYVYEYLDVRAKLESVVRLVHSKLVDIHQTALQAENRYREAKTKFIFDPHQGLMCLEQKLPMSWHAFNQTPQFHEIPEFRAVSDFKSYFASSNITFWSIYRYKPYMEPLNWLPPFKAQAMIVGSQHLTTFDGRHLDLYTVRPCTYLLARDFVRNTYAILLKYNLQFDRITHKLIVMIGENAIELDVFNDSIKLISQRSTPVPMNLQLPIELENGTVYVYQTEDVITIERKKNELRLECNLKFDLCVLELSGWQYGKTAGLLGTINNEPMDDTMSSNGVLLQDVDKFAESWSIDSSDDCTNVSNLSLTGQPENDDALLSTFCSDLFLNKSSEFLSCYDVIDPDHYFKICDRSTSKSEACTVALSYMQACMFYDTYLRIPDVCTNCTMVDGGQVGEGQFKKLEGNSVPRSADIVFIVEGKECNRDIKQNRSIEQLITQLNKELKDQGLVDNRWSLVLFGANGVFDQPRSVILDGQIFAKNAAQFVDFFDNIPVGDGSRDIFAAIVFASKLIFRAGVSKTFILMPCSHCEPENQTLDYSVLYETLLERDVTLHILMDGDFEFEKERLNKIFYGLDATKSYTKKDSRALIGDIDLRRQVKLSKSALGYCTPLSLETNGTIFSGAKLRFDKLASIKKFISVFSKRVAQTAQPNACQNCECTADNNGVTRMECIPCIYPTPVTVDYDAFNLNDSLSALQPLNIDYDQIDIDDN